MVAVIEGIDQMDTLAGGYETKKGLESAQEECKRGKGRCVLLVCWIRSLKLGEDPDLGPARFTVGWTGLDDLDRVRLLRGGIDCLGDLAIRSLPELFHHTVCEMERDQDQRGII